MKITDPGAEALGVATTVDLVARDKVLLAIQPGIYNLAVRVLGHRHDAADAMQEILLKVVTHLSSFRGESAFANWVWRVAHSHLMTARTRSAEAPEVSLEGLGERLGVGLERAANLAQSQGAPAPLTPEDKLEARQVALACTQAMLMALDREQRPIYMPDTVFDLPSKEAAAVVGITPDACHLRGMGALRRPEHRKSYRGLNADMLTWARRDFAAAVKSLVDSGDGQRIGLVGHSLGVHRAAMTDAATQARIGVAVSVAAGSGY